MMRGLRDDLRDRQPSEAEQNVKPARKENPVAAVKAVALIAKNTMKSWDRDMMMSKHLTKLTAVSALLAATTLASGAFAGQEPYVATVCNDRDGYTIANYCNDSKPAGIGVHPYAFEKFYMSVKEYQFTHFNLDEAYKAVPTLPTFAKGETFKASTAINHAEYCYAGFNGAPKPLSVSEVAYGNKTARLKAKNSGVYEWTIVLPKKPEGNLNLAIQCGVFKPEETDVMFCAGEEGEIQGPGRCNQALTLPGQSNILATGLPTIRATAYPGYYTRQFNNYTPFNLTAYRTPSAMAVAFDANGALTNSAVNQVLNGSSATRMPRPHGRAARPHHGPLLPCAVGEDPGHRRSVEPARRRRDQLRRKDSYCLRGAGSPALFFGIGAPPPSRRWQN